MRFLLLLLCVAPLAAQDRVAKLLGDLADAPGPPGFEEPVRKLMVDAMKPYASSIRFDGLGSIIAAQGTAGARLVVDAPIDGVGGVVTRTTPQGPFSLPSPGAR